MDTIAKYKELDSLVKKVEKDFDVSYTEQVTQWGMDCKMFIRHGPHIYAMLESTNYASLKKQAQEFMNQRLTTQNKITMENQITGKVLHISGIETVGQNATEKQTIIVEETGQEYPQSVAIDALKDKVQQLAGISEGDEVTAHFNLRAREYNGRWFQNVNLWKIEKQSDF